MESAPPAIQPPPPASYYKTEKAVNEFLDLTYHGVGEKPTIDEYMDYVEEKLGDEPLPYFLQKGRGLTSFIPKYAEIVMDYKPKEAPAIDPLTIQELKRRVDRVNTLCDTTMGELDKALNGVITSSGVFVRDGGFSGDLEETSMWIYRFKEAKRMLKIMGRDNFDVFKDDIISNYKYNLLEKYKDLVHQFSELIDMALEYPELHSDAYIQSVVESQDLCNQMFQDFRDEILNYFNISVNDVGKTTRLNAVEAIVKWHGTSQGGGGQLSKYKKRKVSRRKTTKRRKTSKRRKSINRRKSTKRKSMKKRKNTRRRRR